LELFNIRIGVSGEGAKVLFYLRQVSKGKRDTDSYNSLGTGHFLEGVKGSWLVRGPMGTGVWRSKWALLVGKGRRGGERRRALRGQG
jgi:hypothetical protein